MRKNKVFELYIPTKIYFGRNCLPVALEKESGYILKKKFWL